MQPTLCHTEVVVSESHNSAVALAEVLYGGNPQGCADFRAVHVDFERASRSRTRTQQGEAERKPLPDVSRSLAEHAS